TVISLLLLGSLLPHLSYSISENGTEARPHSRPYMVSVQENGKHTCGGFLISDQFVMTASHCHTDEALTVLTGVHDLTKKGRTIRFNVKSYHLHLDHTTGNKADLMILELDEKVQLNDTVKTIPIPTTPEEIEVDTNCSIAGWGELSHYGPISLTLREADMMIMNNTECQTQWEDVYIPSQMICVYSEGGICLGDSGGPLVCNNTAVGITAFGSENYCNDPDQPNVFTKISEFLPWIQNVISSSN
ncbi:putative trypsin domain containing protein, partial [Triplophysa rosa]